MSPSPHEATSDERRRSARLLYWSEHTADVAFETGIQRVVRHLRGALRDRAIEVCDLRWDDATRTPRIVGEAGNRDRLEGAWLLVPEIPMTVIARGVDPIQIGRAFSLKTAAIVHDLIPIKMADLYDADTRQLFARYYRMFADADLVFATTNHVAGDLRRYLRRARLRVPEIRVIPLPAQLARRPRVPARPLIQEAGRDLELLTVSTWEPRKNLPNLLRALARLDVGIRLTIAGRRGNFPGYDAAVDALLATMANVTVIDWVDDDTLVDLYRRHDFSVYSSREEGFGLPILESLWLGTPCLCHNGSSMAEVAPGGGTLMIDMTDEDAIADALRSLASQPSLRQRLAAELAARPLRTWLDYAGDVVTHLGLPAQSAPQADQPPLQRSV
jgi:glycosyltransferase involved in cell wall biosynthesis